MAKDDRLRSPVQSDYTEALGRAAFTFATCEWQVVWCSEKICPGTLRKIIDKEMTAGKIAKCFIDLCRNMPASKEREELSFAAKKFATLVEERNRILHGKPCTGPNGEARLSGSGVIEIIDLNNAADSFIECSSELNRMFYGFLQSYNPA
ncbi:hypothetical protein ABRQ09_02770 [Pectobacterium brasiliense]|uniref:hypothetical protein n=1 Tax=Pectobacterium brasiliense TaxID=180957 RepID=UPI0032EBEFA9